MPITRLNDRTTIAIGGEAAEHFLQNLVTPNIEAIGPADCVPAALLTPQGKIQFDFLLSRTEGGFCADIRADIADDFIRRLTLYRLRAAVTFERQTDVTVHAAWGGACPDGALHDRRFPAESGVCRIYGDPAADTDAAAYDRLRIENGVAESGSDYQLSDVWPHDVLMDLNGGVGFRKGCYVGQEVVSRMQHRKSARRRVAIVTADAPLPPSGTAIEAGTRGVGELGTVVGGAGLAIVRTDRVGDALADGTPLTAGGEPVSLALPSWSGLVFQAGTGGDD